MAGCQAWFFNQGIDSVPMTLFYDGHVAGLSTREVQGANAQVSGQSNENFINDAALWQLDTPLGSNGYFQESSYKAGWAGVAPGIAAQTSYHILTRNGIRGRDTIGGQ